MLIYKQYHTVLTIAGSDSSGGAGIQADIKTITATGSYAASVITALTAQNTQGVSAIYAIAPQFIAEQLDAVFNDIAFNAIKIGMLHKPEVIDIVTAKILQWRVKNIILDPVMIAKGGSKLITDDAIKTLQEKLIPRVDLITPNLNEAEVLADCTINSYDAMQDTAQKLAEKFKINVLIKGGHFQDQLSADCLFQYQEKTFLWFKVKRIETINTHGTGCTFSSAIASYLAQGNNLAQAIHKAKHYITQAIQQGSKYQLGKGINPVYHRPSRLQKFINASLRKL